MTPNLRRGKKMESNAFSLLSQMSVGSHQNNRKRHRANSFDDFPVGIMDKDDEDIQPPDDQNILSKPTHGLVS